MEHSNCCMGKWKVISDSLDINLIYTDIRGCNTIMIICNKFIYIAYFHNTFLFATLTFLGSDVLWHVELLVLHDKSSS